MQKLKGAPSASQKGECTRSLSGTVSGIRHGAGRAAIAILSAAKHSSRNLSKRDCRSGGNACCAGYGGCSLWQWPLWCWEHLLYAAECEPLIPIPLDDVRQRLGGGAGGGRIMHQNDALGLLAGLTHYIPVDGSGTGLAAHGILSADIPVYIGISLLGTLLFQLGHHTAPAVATADRVGAAARKAQVMQRSCVDIGRDALFQQLDILPVSICTLVDVTVFMGSRMQRDLVACCRCIRNERQVLFIVARGFQIEI